MCIVDVPVFLSPSISAEASIYPFMSFLLSVPPFFCVYADMFLFFFSPTGIDFKIKTVELQGKKIKLQIW